ncbi:MAG: glycosyltransferase family 4 protein [Pseudobdellovibrionaceae bacterium]
MTRVLVVAESLYPFCWPLALTLKQQQFEVTILTSKESNPIEKSGIQIIPCFEKWSIKEFAQLLPIMIRLQPQIIHFIQPSKKFSQSWSPAFHLLAVAARLWPNAKVVTSILDVSDDYPLTSWMLPLLQNSDLITASSDHLVATLKTENNFRSDQICSSLPPLIENNELQLEVDERIPALKPYVFVPCRWMEQILNCSQSVPMIELLLDHDPLLNLVFSGSWENVPLRTRKTFWENPQIKKFENRMLVLGDNRTHIWPAWIKNSLFTLPAIVNLSRPELWLCSRSSLEMQRPSVLTLAQVEQDSLPLESGRNCWILKNSPYTRSLAEILILKKIEQLTWTQGEFGEAYLDKPGNRLSRLYIEAQLDSISKDR